MNRVTHLASVLLCALCSAQQPASDWQQELHAQIKAQQLDAALQTAERRLAQAPADLEAHGWRARVLAWKGRWSEAEAEYRLVLEQAPNDTDILTGLADVLIWQQRWKEALPLLDRASSLSPSQSDILIRRARVLAMMGQAGQARAEFRTVLQLDPGNKSARAGLSGLGSELRHELGVGVDMGWFNYADSFQVQAVSLSSRWTARWSTVFAASFFQCVGQDASKLSGATAFRFTPHDWLNFGGATADDRGIIAQREAFFEYGHGFRFHNRLIRGLESSFQQRWLWFQDAEVMTETTSHLVYLPRDWTWSVAATGARSQFSAAGSEWQPSGATRLTFPLYRSLTGNLSFAVGTENFVLVDQIGRFAARSFAGGLHYRFNATHDLRAYVAIQDRSRGRTQNGCGIGYGFRF